MIINENKRKFRRPFFVELDNNRTIDNIKQIAKNFNADVFISNGKVYLINEDL